MKAKSWGYKKSDLLNFMLISTLAIGLTGFIIAMVYAPIITLIVTGSLIGVSTLVTVISILLIGNSVFNLAKEIAPLAKPLAAFVAVGVAMTLAPVTQGKSLEILNSSRREDPKERRGTHTQKTTTPAKLHQHSFLKPTPSRLVPVLSEKNTNANTIF